MSTSALYLLVTCNVQRWSVTLLLLSCIPLWTPKSSLWEADGSSVKQIPALHGTWMFITMLTKKSLLDLTWDRWSQGILYLWSIFILPSYLYLNTNYVLQWDAISKQSGTTAVCILNLITKNGVISFTSQLLCLPVHTGQKNGKVC